MTPQTTILTDAAKCFTTARQNIYEGASLLYRINEENLWKEGYDSFGEFIEQECQLSQGYASKLIQSWKFYIVEGGLSHEKLNGVDAEKLYLALKLPDGTPEKRLIQAQTLSRQELRAELAEKDGVDCLHEKTITICASCHARV